MSFLLKPINPSKYKFVADNLCDTFYVADIKIFQSNFNNLLKEFQMFYQNTIIAYSYKTNYAPSFCSKVKNLNGYAEVVSDMELQLAKYLGVPDEMIFFNGPSKSIVSSLSHLMQGGLVNIDNMTELDELIENIPNYNEKKLRVGLRCNFSSKTDLQSRFGFDVTNAEFERAVALVLKNKHLKLSSLHVHNAGRDIATWSETVSNMIETISQMKTKQLSEIEYISLGGGLYGGMPEALSSQLAETIPTFSQYAEVSAKLFAAFVKEHKKYGFTPKLVIEPGTALVADAMQFVCRVKSVKKINGKTFVNLSGSGHNLGTITSKLNLPIKIITTSKSIQKIDLVNADFVGYTCIESDRLYEGFNGKIAIGDLVVFDCVGSYSIVMKPPFILPNVPVVEISDSDNNFNVLKRQETFNDIFNTYVMP